MAKFLTLAALAIHLLAIPCLAGGYNFINIADNSGPFSTFTDNPALNNSRVVAFHANLDAGGSGAYTGSDGALTTTADATTGHSNIQWVDINDNGAVAFFGHGSSGANIFRSAGSGAPYTNIIPAGSNVGAFYTPISLNNSGVVIFTSERTDIFGINGIYSGNGGPVTTIVESTSGYDPDPGGTRPNINNAGTVAFKANSFEPSEGIYTTTGGTVTPIGTIAGMFRSSMDTGPMVSDNGTVIFRSTLDDNSNGLFMGNGGPITTIATTTGPYSGFLNAAINSSDDFVFLAGVDVSLGGGRGLFTGPDPVADKIIRSGDPLFGSTVTTLGIEFFHGLNDHGDVAFKYILADGRQGIALATVPEPTSLTLVVLSAALLGPVSRRTRRWITPHCNGPAGRNGPCDSNAARRPPRPLNVGPLSGLLSHEEARGADYRRGRVALERSAPSDLCFAVHLEAHGAGQAPIPPPTPPGRLRAGPKR